MPPHLAVYNDDDTPSSAIAIEMEIGETSPVFVRKIFNDKDAAFGDTTSSIDAKLVLLASIAGSSFASEGRPILDEKWTRIRVTHYLNSDGSETTANATSTQPFGTNAEFPIRDLAPQEGVRISFQVFAPGIGLPSATKIKISVDGNRASSPLSRFTALATGSGIVPPDRISGVRSLVRGSEVTADSSDTITIDGGTMVYEGTTTTFPAEDATFDLLDGDAVAIGAGESYRVTLSRDADAVLTITKAAEGAADFPDMPDGDVFVRQLIVTSADGVAVTVAAASLAGSPTYTGLLVRPGAGLTVIISDGDAIVSPADLRQYHSHETIANVTANSTNRIWQNSAGDGVVTLTDVAPEFGANLLAFAITDAATVTEIVDARRFAHRALTDFPIEFAYRTVWSTMTVPAHGLAMAIAHDDLEIEEVRLNLTDAEASWTAGAITADVYVFPPGAPVPFPLGGIGVGGVSLFTSSATDDQRPSIAFDATDLQAVSRGHEVRRIVKGSRLLLSIVSTVAAPDPEFDQEIRLTLIARRSR